MKKLTPEDLARYKDRLLAQRERLQGEITEMANVVFEDGRALGEHDRGVSESADKELTLQHGAESVGRMVRDAIQRMEEGRYGICVSCGKCIPCSRLDVVAYTPYCVDCERRSERGD